MLVDLSDRPLVHLVLKAVTGYLPGRAAHRTPYSPPALREPPSATATANASSSRAAVMADALLRDLLIAGGRADPLATLLSEAVVWTPSYFARSKAEAADVLDDGTMSPLTEVTVTTATSAVVPPRVYLEWRLSGRFTEPCFVAEDLLLPPTGELVECAGVLVATFRGGRVEEAHLYYDHLGVVEQLVQAR